MAEQWIAAHQAHDLAPDTHVLCSRLHAGLIPARARLFQFNHEDRQDCDVPSWFWWARGRAALEADWTAGDFSTLIDGKAQCRAFGVEFGLAGVLEMLPFEDRAAIARRLSVMGNPDWIAAKEARQLACTALGYSPNVAGDAIIDMARLGMASARAIMAEGASDQIPAGSTWQEREWDVPAWFWKDFGASADSRGEWELGKFWGRGLSPRGPQKIVLSGVHFLRSSLAAEAQAPSIPEPEGQAKRGRRPTYDWDAVVAAIWGEIFLGDFKPDTQADIERAMQQRLAKGDKEPSESTVRPFARRIWNEISKA
jgi:hypothetical protein